VERRASRSPEQERNRNLSDLEQPQTRNRQALRTAQTVNRIVQKINQRHHPFVLKITQKAIVTVKQQVTHNRLIKQGPPGVEKQELDLGEELRIRTGGHDKCKAAELRT
jgi:hypothetical protein